MGNLIKAVLPGLSSGIPIHPMFVHFPIVLWLSALLFWAVSVIGNLERFWPMGRWMLFLGTLGGFVAVGTGLDTASDLSQMNPHPEVTLTHRNFMIAATSLALVTAVIAFLTRKDEKRSTHIILLLLMIAVAVVMTLGADRGAQMVYAFGLGTS